MGIFDFSSFQPKRAVFIGLGNAFLWTAFMSISSAQEIKSILPGALFSGVYFGVFMEMFFCRAFENWK